MEKRLEGKVAIVTGAASGIGEAVANIFAVNGCKVALVDIGKKRLKQLESDISNYKGICLAFCNDRNIGVTVINPYHVKTPMTQIIDKGLYDGTLQAYLDGRLDEKEYKEGIHASCIDVENVAEITLYVATRTPDVTNSANCIISYS